MEVNIKGPRDAFLENYNKNIGLIRKRIKDENLRFKEYIIGRRTKTKIAVTYINDIAEHERVKHIIDKISDIDTDAILDASYLKDFFRRDSRTGFPTIITTERPDIVCSSILDGKIAIVVENSPAVLVFPAVLTDFIHAADDNYQKAINVSLTRILRMIALFITLYAPALYVAATTFNQEIIPSTLLLSIAKQRSGVPFPTTFSVLLLMITFEILRESDMRMPESMGTSISIVGALVLGEAAVSAGIVSPIVIIVIAITSITGLLFSDLDIINAFRWWRLIFLLFASTLGLVGIIGASLIFVVKLCRIESMGVPYLTPFSPLYIKSLKNSTISLPNNESKERPQYYTENIRRMKWRK